MPATTKRLSLLGRFGGWRSPEAPVGSSDGDAAIELLNEVVAWWVLVVWFERQRGMIIWVVCDGLVNIYGAVGGLLCARGRQTSREPTSRQWRNSPSEAVDDMA